MSATSQVTLDSNCRFTECNLGNLIADAMVYVRSMQYNGTDGYWTDAPIALMNGGGKQPFFTYLRRHYASLKSGILCES